MENKAGWNENTYAIVCYYLGMYTYLSQIAHIGTLSAPYMRYIPKYTVNTGRYQVITGISL